MNDSTEAVDVASRGVSRKLWGLPYGRACRIIGGETRRCVAEICEHDVWVFGIGVEAQEDI